MAIQIGQQLGSLEVTALLGKGGMGEVYRARDTKLKRDVAIKILPDEFARDADRVNRFQREAEVLASLSHPNIAGIYDLQHSGDTQFLIMELVEGETLADRIKRGPIPMEDALQIGKSICEALEAAHEKGIVHRDLKQANVKLTPDGKVKVLDFGLAKAMESTPTTTLSNSPTLLSVAASNAGMILGTAPYMSPEQVKGKTVDRRADIWAFGVVLYEMLTGKIAFSGETVSETMAFVITKEPDWSALPANTPWRLQRLLRRCLKKDAHNRLQAIGEARIAIEEMQNGPETSALTPLGVQSSDHRWMFFSLVVTLIAAAMALPTIRYFSEVPPVAPPEVRLEVNTPSISGPLTLISFAISPDGRRLAFVASNEGKSQLWLRQLDTVAARPLPGTDGAILPFWSPDSRSIGFFADGKLKRIDVGGGLPQSLADTGSASAAGGSFGGTWSQQGVILFAAGPIFRVPASGGEAVPVAKVEAPFATAFPQFLPDGRRFLFSATDRSRAPEVYLASLDSPQVTRITAADSTGFYEIPGWLLFLRQGALVARHFDESRGELVGDPVTVTDQITVEPFFRNAAFSASASGAIAYRAGTTARTQLTWFDRAGKPVGTVGELDDNNTGYPELSPDGRRVAVDRIVQGNQDLWLIDILRGSTTRFTFDSGNDRRPIWSPDGTQVVFDANRKRTFDLYIRPSNGSGTDQLLFESSYSKVPDGWSPDGRFLLYNENNGKTSDVLALPLQGEKKPIPVANSPFSENNGQFSPDGRWIAYQSNEAGRFEIYVVPFPSRSGKWQVSTGGGTAPRWRHDGKELFFLAPNGSMMGTTVSASDTSFEAASPVMLFQTQIVGGGQTQAKQQYTVSADGRFLVNVATGDFDNTPITLILNWHPPKP
jgi:serine/threonine protein kinase